jgi:hypothetical protein
MGTAGFRKTLAIIGILLSSGISIGLISVIPQTAGGGL